MAEAYNWQKSEDEQAMDNLLIQDIDLTFIECTVVGFSDTGDGKFAGTSWERQIVFSNF